MRAAAGAVCCVLSCGLRLAYGRRVTIKSGKFIPALLCCAVAGLMMLLQTVTQRDESFGFTRRLEWMTYDWRAKLALSQPSPYAPNLGFVFVNDETISRVLRGDYGYAHGLYWPRHVYGRLVNELGQQGAQTIAFDVLFTEERRDHPKVTLSGGSVIPSDHYFTNELRRAGNVVLGVSSDGISPRSFRTSAAALGDISATLDLDGILRRAKAFEDYLIWHPAILQAWSVIDDFAYSTNELTFPGADGQRVRLPVSPDGAFELAALMEAGGTQFPEGVSRRAQAFTRQRVWDLGLTAAARYLGLDLLNAQVDPGRRIRLRGVRGVERIIPIDAENRFYIDWSLTSKDRRITQESVHSLLARHRQRELGDTNETSIIWHGKIAIIGSITTGNDLRDHGATPLEKDTHLTSRYWNTANCLIIDRFIRQPDFSSELYIICSLAILAGMLTWNLRAVTSAIGIIVLAGVYLGITIYFYIEARYWLPLVLPTATLFATHSALISYRVVFEQRERRRVRNIFAKMVSPNVATELLKAERLSVDGARREVTVFFSDVRGFTELTEESHARAVEHVQEHKLSSVEAAAYFDSQAADVLQTVNLYLGTIADTVKRHDGTLDKYIGDCVMAFWNAPTPVPKHALACVRAAIDSQCAIDQLNAGRAAENQRREKENDHRVKNGQPPLPMLKLLTMGSGINTGVITVGLMGSHQHTVNYTVFGRDVNLASRLEGLSGRGRIVIGEATYRALQQDDPALAATCRELEPATVKGFRSAVRIFEVPWRPGGDTESIARSTTPASGPALAP